MKNGIDTIGQSVLSKVNGARNGVHEDSSCQNEETHDSCSNGQSSEQGANGCLNIIKENEGKNLEEVNCKKDLVNGVK